MYRAIFASINKTSIKYLSSPFVVAVEPFDSDIEVPLDSKIRITFSRPMNKGSAEENFNISPEIPGVLAWESDTSMIFSPSQDFKRDQNIRVAVGGAAKAMNLRSIREPYTADFQTLSNPHIAFASPTGSMSDEVESIVVMFNKSVKKPPEDILEVTPRVEGVRKWVGSSAFVIKPENLVIGQTYTVKLIVDLESVDGGFLDKGYTFEFVNFAPAPLHITGDETNYYSQDSLEINPNGPITIYFNQEVDQKDVESKVKLLHRASGKQIPVRAAFVSRTVDDDASYYSSIWQEKWVQKVRFFPLTPLDPSEDYSLTLESGFTNESGSAFSDVGIGMVFNTADLPGFVSSSIPDGDIDVGEEVYLKFTFSSPMDLDDLEKNIVVTISGDDASEVYLYPAENYKVVEYNRFLKRSSKVDIFIPARTKDKFGRALGEDVSLSFTTAPYHPSYSILPGGTYITTFSSNIDTRIVGRGVNISKLEYNLYSLNVNQFIELNRTERNKWKSINKDSAPKLGFKKFGSWVQELDLEQDIHTDFLFNFNKDAGADLKPGIYFLDVRILSGTAESKVEAHDNIAFVVGDVSVTTKISAENMLVWATSLSSRKLKEGYNVKVFEMGYPGQVVDYNYSPKSADSPFEPVIIGITNSDGVFLTKDTADLSSYNGNYLTVVEKNGDIGVSTSSWDSGIGVWEFNDVDYSSVVNKKGANDYKAYAFSDRTLYRPGDELKYKALIRKNNLHSFTAANELSSVKISISNYYNGDQQIYEQEFVLDANGSNVGNVDGKFTIPISASLGRYQLQVKGAENEIYYTTEFDVQEYSRPEFEVVAAVPKQDVIRKDSITLFSESKYFYGAPLFSRPYDTTLFNRKFIFRDSKYSEFKFYSDRKYYGDDNIWRGFEEDEVMSESGLTDSLGIQTLKPTTLTEDGVSEVYTFETAVLGVSGRRFVGSDEYVVHMAEHYTGINSLSYVGKLNSNSEFEVKTVRPNGEVVSNIEVDVNIYRRKYFRVKQKENTGSFYYEVTYEDELVDTQKVTTNSRGDAKFDYIPKDGGLHIVEVISYDGRRNISIADTYLYVVSSDSGYWKRENHDRVELVSDKDEYSVGDVATFISTATLEKTVGLLTVEAENILDYKIITQDSSSDSLSLKIKDTYIPNVYASVMLIEPGTSVFDPPEFKMGIKKLKVDASKNKLDIEISTPKDVYAPKESGTAQVLVRDKFGKGVANASVTIALVDDALMSIAPVKRSGIFEHFYSERYLGVLTTQSLTESLDRINANTEIGAKGGSGSKGGAGGEYADLTRENFSETALWVATVETDSSGRAVVDFKLPDSITRWNLFVLAQSADNEKFGQNIHKFSSAMEVFGLPAVPRFARVGDSFELSVVVHNNSAKAKNLTVGIETTGIQVDGGYTRTVFVESGSSKRVAFAGTSSEEGTAQITFSVNEGNQTKDIVKKEFLVLPFGLEVVQSVANVLNFDVSEEFYVDPASNKNFGGLSVSAFGSYIGLLDEDLDNDYFSIESTFDLSNEIMLQVYRYKYLQSGKDEGALEVKSGVSDNVGYLLALQNPDGGWSGWGRGNSSVWASVYAMEALSEAKVSGILVDSGNFSNGLKFIQDSVSQPSLIDQRCAAHYLYVLELGGSDQTGRIQQLYSTRAALSDKAKADLILAMVENNGRWDTFIAQLKAELLSKADLASQRVFWNDSCSGYGSSASATATILRSFNKIDPGNPVTSLAIRYLIEKDSYYESRFSRQMKTVSLIENYLERGIKNRDSQIELKVNAASVSEGFLKKSDKASEFKVNLPISELLDGINKVSLSLQKGGNVFYSMVLKELVSFDDIEAMSNDIALEREFFDEDGNVILNNKFQVGENYVVKLTVASPGERSNLVLEDYLPAGFESVNGTLVNESSLVAAQAREMLDEESDARNLYASHVEMRDSQTNLYFDRIGAGLYEYVYVVRATVPGTFKLRPAQIYEENSPDVRANTDGGAITVTF